jgi:hypothetical protein
MMPKGVVGRRQESRGRGGGWRGGVAIPYGKTLLDSCCRPKGLAAAYPRGVSVLNNPPDAPEQGLANGRNFEWSELRPWRMQHVPIKLTYVNSIGTRNSKLSEAMDPMPGIAGHFPHTLKQDPSFRQPQPIRTPAERTDNSDVRPWQTSPESFD